MKQPIHILTLAGILTLGFSGTVFAGGFGFEQSPIDIRPEFSVYSGSLPALNYNYGPVDLHVVNTGSPDEHASIKGNVTSGTPNLVLSGTTYNLLQFHFHTESENLKEGYQYPMELHLVHQKVGSTGYDDLLVTGLWIEEGAHNSVLDEMFDNLPPTSADTYDITGFALDDLLPSDLTSYRFDGSLTTPPFTEGVQWIMLDQPLFMDHDQIKAFHDIFHEGNTRAAQDLHGRIILTDNPNFVPEGSYSLGLFAMALVSLGVAGARRARSPRASLSA